MPGPGIRARTVLITPTTSTNPAAPPANHNAATVVRWNRTIGIRHANRCARRRARTELRLARNSAYRPITMIASRVDVDWEEASAT